MIIAQGNAPAGNSCSCDERPRSAAPAERRKVLPEIPSLDLVSQSLVSAEVLRLRNALEGNVGHFEFEGPGPLTHIRSRSIEQGEQDRIQEPGLWSKVRRVSRLLSTEAQELLSPSRIASAARDKTELALECVGRVCKRLVSGLSGTLVPSWFALLNHATTETALAGVKRCFSSVRDFFSEAVPASKVVATRTNSGVFQQEPLSSTSVIPRVVVKRRSESHGADRRLRLRGPRRSREVAELSEESDAVEVESVTPTGREDEHRDFEESTEEERVGKVCRRIREIDAQYGSTPNNPRVAELLAQLGTHYDSIERVIETVYSLQLEEVIEEQKTQAAERIRERKWLKSERSFES